MTSNLISVIVPSFNSANTIGRLLEILTRQELEQGWSLEILVVEGVRGKFSPDGTCRIVRQFPVTLLMGEGQGAGANRNQGILHARGDLFIFVDSDCIPASAGFVQEHTRLHHGSSSLTVACGARHYDLQQRGWVADLDFSCNSGEWRMDHLTPGAELNRLASGNCSVPKAVVEKVGLFDERFRRNEDVEWSYRLNALGIPVVACPAAVVLHSGLSGWKQVIRHSFVRYYCLAEINSMHIPSLRDRPCWEKALLLAGHCMKYSFCLSIDYSARYWKLRRRIGSSRLVSLLSLPLVWGMVAVTYLGEFIGGWRYLFSKSKTA